MPTQLRYTATLQPLAPLPIQRLPRPLGQRADELLERE
jgi:hypothetical protein